MAKGPLLQYTDKLYDIFDDIGDKVSDKLMGIESDPILDNEIGIEMVDKSQQDWSFDVKIAGKWRPMKVGQLIRYFLGNTFTEEEIRSFTQKYNLLKKGKPLEKEPELSVSKSVKVEVPKFVWNPKDVRSTFISLVTESLTDRNTLFFSEKIWKPIMVGHPFLLLGSKHSLKYLKNLGYKIGRAHV